MDLNSFVEKNSLILKFTSPLNEPKRMNVSVHIERLNNSNLSLLLNKRGSL